MTDQVTCTDSAKSTTGPLALRLNDQLGPAPRWWHCDTHGPGTRSAWGCPECVREMRAEIERLRTALRIAKDGYASEAATGQPVLPQWRERTVALIDAALGANAEKRETR